MWLRLLETVKWTLESYTLIWKVTYPTAFTKFNYAINIQYFITEELLANKNSCCSLIGKGYGHHFLM